MSRNLILHSGANSATFEQVMESDTPDPTKTHHPIPHGKLIETVTDHIELSGWDVAESEWGMWGPEEMPDARMFGVMTIQPKRVAVDPSVVHDITALAPSDYGLVVGLRNAHDKMFAASMAMGSRVFVCDNLAFSGEIQIARKHTRHILRDLDRLVIQAVGKIAAMRVSQDRRLAAYKGYELTDAEVHDLLVRAVDGKVMANSYIPKVLAEWREPRHPEFEDRTAWSLFNGFTEAFKATNPEGLVGRTTRLHGLLDLRTGAIEDIPEADFEVVEEDTEVRGL